MLGGSMAASQQRGMDHADVLIIGAGAAGGVAARRLLEGGLTVVALVQGQWQDRTSYRGSQWDWELTSAKQWSQMPEVRCAPADYPIDTRDSDMDVHNFNGVGGGTVLFNAIWPRLLPSNFDSRSRWWQPGLPAGGRSSASGPAFWAGRAAGGALAVPEALALVARLECHHLAGL
jgi:choline dehydrogenase-like flavoprotein